MLQQIQPGVNLHIIPTEKYKTIRLFVRFSNRHEKLAAAKRTLLTSLLETNSLNYPTQTAFSSHLAELYGASFGVGVGKKGQFHQVNVGMSIVNGKYVNDPTLLQQAFAFLKEVLFYPNIKAEQFDLTTFNLEKENLLAYLASTKEDKQYYASLRLQEIYFGTDENQMTPSFGNPKDVATVTASELARTHQQMITDDQVDIFVVGDVSEQQVLAEVKQLPFAPREILTSNFFYQQTSQPLKEVFEVEEVTQAKLNLGFQTDIYYTDADRFALMVFNGLFGGFPHSKLFTNVREKANLAYYASSNYDSFRGFLNVQTGIDGQNYQQALQLIKEQLVALQTEPIDDVALEQTKAMLINQFLLSQDNPQALIERQFLETCFPATRLSEGQFIEAIQAVTSAEVKAVAQKIKLQAVFFLDGGNDNA
ncbi:MAG: EF-P 5-aminopentanol modification-associated protein YfmF [Enterococcus sp.]